MARDGWIVHKFGGASLAGVPEYRRAADVLLAGEGARRAVIVSAPSGVTDALLALLAAPSAAGPGAGALRERFLGLAGGLLDDGAREAYAERLDADLATVGAVLEAVALLGRVAPEARSLVSGFGEVWSARLLAAYLRVRGADAGWLDAREVLTISTAELGPVVDWEDTAERLAERLDGNEADPLVVTGYVARDAAGAPADLGRNGSDFSASIFAALLEARELVIWTDVDGVMSGDPRRVREAAVIPRLSYHEAMELAYFGAKVIHPRTMGPVVAHGVPIRIRNSFRPDLPGTLIAASPGSDGGVRGITTIDGIALLNLEGAGMIGVPGTADRLFGALREAGISVVMISQGSSEHSICFAVPEDRAQAARQVVTRAFALEIAQGQVQGIEVSPGCSILAIVGDGMRGMPGVAASLFGALGNAGINVRAIAQGASERNISAVIDGADSTRALRAAHSAFYLSPQTLSVGLIGPGSVGGALIRQLAGEMPRLRREASLDIRLRGVMGSRRMVLAEDALDPGGWREAMEAGGLEADLDAFAAHVHAEHLPHSVIVDCTASAEIAERYADWLRRGIHVVTPNKKAGAGALARWRETQAARRDGNSRWLYETTVGAGLPIIQTLRDLRETGDSILAIEGILSGTLAYLFNLFDGSRPFSAIVREAKEKGYTEPDPRDDLSGMDVARKVVILGREMGLELELADVEVESLVPDGLAGGGIEEFLAGLGALDEDMTARRAAAEEAGAVLRYVGRLDREGRASVRLERIDGDHPFARISLTDNVVRFVTSRYRETPLIVRGPGAGPEVTAAGVFADLLRLAGNLGANL